MVLCWHPKKERRRKNKTFFLKKKRRNFAAQLDYFVKYIPHSYCKKSFSLHQNRSICKKHKPTNQTKLPSLFSVFHWKISCVVPLSCVHNWKNKTKKNKKKLRYPHTLTPPDGYNLKTFVNYSSILKWVFISSPISF